MVKHGVQIRIWSLGEYNTQSWVRISHGSNQFVIDSINNNTESLEDLPEEQASQLKVKDFAARLKAKAKPQRKELVEYSPSIIPMNERKWIDIELGNSSLSLRTRFRGNNLRYFNEKMTEQFNFGGSRFFRSQFAQSIHWSDDRWKACLAAGGGAKRIYQNCSDISGIIVYFRALHH